MSAPTPTPNQKPSKPFPAWRLPKGIMNASDSELEKSIESCERWEWFGGGLVVVGVIAAVAIAALHPPYDSFWEQWGSSLADSLVAIGVALEIKLGQMAGLRQNELKRRSDEKAAIAEARAAEALQKAKEAALELAKYKAPRELSIQQQRRVADKIRIYPSIQFDSAVAMGNSEALTLLEMIEGAARAAEWTQLNWREHSSGTPLVLNRPGLPTVGNTTLSGVLIQYEAEERARLEAAANALASALSAEEIPAVARANMQGVIAAANTTAIHIFVGEKI